MDNRIAACRKARGYTQEALAQALNVSRSTVGMWESRNNLPEKHTLCRLADLLGVTTDELLGREPLTSNDQPPHERRHPMITLNHILELAEDTSFSIHVPITDRVTVDLRLDTRDTAQLDDVTRLYGDYRVADMLSLERGKLSINLARP